MPLWFLQQQSFIKEVLLVCRLRLNYVFLRFLQLLCGVRGSNVTEKKTKAELRNLQCLLAFKLQLHLLSESSTKCCLSLPPLVLSVLVHPAVTTRGQNLSAFPVSESGCTVALFTILPRSSFFFPPFFRLAPTGIN